MPDRVDPQLRPFLEELERPRHPWSKADACLVAAVFALAAFFAFVVVTLFAYVLRSTLSADYGDAAAPGPVIDGLWRWATAAVAGALAALAVVATHGRDDGVV